MVRTPNELTFNTEILRRCKLNDPERFIDITNEMIADLEMQCFACFKCGDAFDISAIPRAIEHALLKCRYIDQVEGKNGSYTKNTNWTNQKNEGISKMTKSLQFVMDKFTTYEPPSQNRKEFLNQWKQYLELSRSLNHNQRKGVIFKSVPEGVHLLRATRCTEPACGGITSTDVFLSDKASRNHRKSFKTDPLDDNQSHILGQKLEDKVTVFIPPKMRKVKGVASFKLLFVVVIKDPTTSTGMLNIADHRPNIQAEIDRETQHNNNENVKRLQCSSESLVMFMEKNNFIQESSVEFINLESTFSLRDGIFTDPRFKKEMLEFIGFQENQLVKDTINKSIDAFMKKNNLDLMKDTQEDQQLIGDHVNHDHLLNKIFEKSDQLTGDAELIKSLWLIEMIANLAGKMVVDSCYLANKLLEQIEDEHANKQRGKRSYSSDPLDNFSSSITQKDLISVLITVGDKTIQNYASMMQDLVRYAVRCWSLSMLADLYPNVAPIGKHYMKYMTSDLKEALGVIDIEIDVLERRIGSISDLLVILESLLEKGANHLNQVNADMMYFSNGREHQKYKMNQSLLCLQISSDLIGLILNDFVGLNHPEKEVMLLKNYFSVAVLQTSDGIARSLDEIHHISVAIKQCSKMIAYACLQNDNKIRPSIEIISSRYHIGFNRCDNLNIISDSYLSNDSDPVDTMVVDENARDIWLMLLDAIEGISWNTTFTFLRHVSKSVIESRRNVKVCYSR